jgi:hypothetical protein
LLIGWLGLERETRKQRKFREIKKGKQKNIETKKQKERRRKKR